MDTSITGQTHMYTLVGCPVSHSISPVIQNSIFVEKGLNSKYITLSITPEKIRESITMLRDNFKGLNVTIPHKQAIMEYLDVVDDKALLCGAVNTVKNEHGRLMGFNTDGYGFMKAFECLGIDMKDKEVLMIGAGGGARAILCELLQNHCHVTIINRTVDKAKKLQEELAGHFPDSLTIISDWDQLQGHYDCLVNSTPIGMSPNIDKSPIEPEYLSRFDIVYDLIYNPRQTKLLADAKGYGCTIINGLPMLFYQAVEANRIWTGLSLSDEKGQEIYEKTVKYLGTL